MTYVEHVIQEMFSDEKVIKLLKNNALQSCVNYINDKYGTYSDLGIFYRTLRESGVDYLKYLLTIDRISVQEAPTNDFSKYTNLKAIGWEAFSDSRFPQPVILPKSIINISSEAFTGSFFDGGLQIYSDSLKMVCLSAFSDVHGVVQIDDNIVKNEDEVIRYLRSLDKISILNS